MSSQRPSDVTAGVSSKIGLRGRLLLAFVGISMLAVVAGLAGQYVFIQVTQALNRMGATIPPSLAAVELSRESEQVLAVGPRLLSVRTDEEVERLSAAASSDLGTVVRLVDRLRTATVEPKALDELSLISSTVGDNLAHLKNTSLERVRAANRKEKLINDAFAAYREFGSAWNRRFAELQSQVLQLRNALSSASTPQERRSAIDRFDQALVTLLSLEQIQREAGLVFEFLNRGAAIDDIVSLQSQAAEARRSLRGLHGRIDDLEREMAAGLVEPAQRLGAIVLDSDGLFVARHREIEAIGNGRRLVLANQELGDQLSLAVSGLVARARSDIDAANAETRSVQKVGQTIQLSVIALSLISSALIVWLYVSRSIVARIAALSNSTLAIASGRRDVSVSASGNDEVAAMARAVQIFRENAIALDQLLAEREQAAMRLEKMVERRTRDLSESLQQQTATADLLKIINRSTFDLQAVLDSLVESAARVCEADRANIWRPKGTSYRLAASYGIPPEYKEYMEQLAMEPGRKTVVGRILLEGKIVHVHDVRSDPEYPEMAAKISGNRTILGIPLLREGTTIGVITLTRASVKPFTDKQIELVNTFADQAVIAIENVRLFDEIRDKSQQLEVASQHKSHFLANMSHELRTPLNAILGFNELIMDGLLGEVPVKMQDAHKRIHSNGVHLLGLINDVLDLSKIEAGQLTLSSEDYSIGGVIHSVLTAVESLAAEKKLALKAALPPDLPKARGDARRMVQVLLNLVGNAIKFTEAGEVVVTASAANGSFTIAVSDTGPGIADAEQTKIFEEFQQADSTTTRAKGGTGLGLSIAKSIVEMHGGRIWLESSRGQGSTFFITLPLIVEKRKTHQ